MTMAQQVMNKIERLIVKYHGDVVGTIIVICLH